MKKLSITRIAMLVALFAFFPLLGTAQMLISIQVSPNVLNLQNQGQVVTVHTDIAYGAVAATTVTLNGVAIDHWKADNQGNFVAKFLIEDIKALPLNIGQLNTLTLIGTTTNGLTFTGTYAVKVINVMPSGKTK